MASSEAKPATMVTEKPKRGVTVKPVKEKKVMVVKEKKSKSKPEKVSHPPYFQMIKEALIALKEKSGSSPHAIAKYIEEKHKSVLPTNFKKMLGLQLKNSASKGKLTKVRASYKLSDAEKKGKASKPSKPVTKKADFEKKVMKKTTEKVKPKVKAPAVTAPKAKAVKKVETPKKVVAKKVVSAKKPKKVAAVVKPKQPKSIKSPVVKKAKKSAA